jgi:hypothetical protein
MPDASQQVQVPISGFQIQKLPTNRRKKLISVLGLWFEVKGQTRIK